MTLKRAFAFFMIVSVAAVASFYAGELAAAVFIWIFGAGV